MKINEVFDKDYYRSVVKKFTDACNKKTNGNTLFHGSGRRFDDFDNSKLVSSNNSGFHFAKNIHITTSFASYPDYNKERLFTYAVDISGYWFYDLEMDTRMHSNLYVFDQMCRQYYNGSDSIRDILNNPKGEKLFHQYYSSGIFGLGSEPDKNPSRPYPDDPIYQEIHKNRVPLQILKYAGYHGYKYVNAYEGSSVKAHAPDKSLDSYVISALETKNINIVGRLEHNSFFRRRND